MSIIKLEDILAYQIGDQIVSPEGLTDEERKNLTQDQVLTEEDLRGDAAFIFCDRTKKLITEISD